MSRFSDAEKLKLFLSTSTTGNAAATCETLKISRATFYRTIEWIVEQVMAAQHHNLASTKSPKHHLKLLIASNALAHPTWGCSRHAKELSSVRSISGPSVQALLNELGLRTRTDRINSLVAKYLAKEIHQLTDEQRKAIVEVNPSVADAHLVPDKTDLAIGVGAISVSGASESNLKLLVFLELSSLFVFGKLVRSRRGRLGNIDTQLTTNSDLEELLNRTARAVCHCHGDAVARKYLNPPILRSRKRISYYRQDDERLDSVSMIIRRVQNDLLGPRSAVPFSGAINDIEKAFLGWSLAWNLSTVSQEFPTFGRPPAAILGLSEVEVHGYLRSTLSCDHQEKRR